jgi:peptide/nickel transport system ATP-binding protein
VTVREDGPRLAVLGLVKTFRRRGARLRAVDGVSLAVGPGETLGLVGESGSGKSTLARAVLRLVEPDAGRVLYRRADGAEVDLLALGPRALRAQRRDLQIVFQDPRASLNPRRSAAATVEEVLRVHGLAGARTAPEHAARLFEEVGLDPALGKAYPHELSGGERQRVALARALATGPRVLVCDEATASLDVTVQARVLALLADLRARRGLSYLFISHDLGVVRAMAGRVAVMLLGRIVESGAAADVLERPAHPYTQALCAAVPRVEPGALRPVPLAGEPPSPLDPPQGCPFHPRCPLAEERCRRELPAPVRVTPTHGASCHLLQPGAPGPADAPRDAP